MNDNQQSHALAGFIVDHRRLLVLVVVVGTAFLALCIPGFKHDQSMSSAVNTAGREYQTYVEFLEVFGNEEFILIALKSFQDAGDPGVLKALQRVTRDIEVMEDVEEVFTLSNLSLFQNRGGKFGSFPLLIEDRGRLRPPDNEVLSKVRKSIPGADLLVSEDLRTVGIIVNISQESRFDPARIGRLLETMKTSVEKRFPQDAEYRIVGAPVIRHAIQRYNVRSAIVIGILCLLFGNLVSIYIFKSLKIAAIKMLVVGLSVVWLLGLMSLLGVGLNPVTALSFGLILIVTAAAVIHIVTHYNERRRTAHDGEEAAKQALAVVGQPCLMCAVTTATGFASIMVSSIPMVKQLGLIMSLGVLVSYLLAVIVTPALLILMRPPTDRAYTRMSRDWVARTFAQMEHFVFEHYRICATAGILVVVLMLAGVPRIGSETQLLAMFSDSTKEVQDMNFVEQNLSHIYSLELVLEAENGAFKRPALWKKVRALNVSLSKIPDVVGTVSLLEMLEHLHRTVSDPDRSSESVLSRPGLVSELSGLMSLSAEGRSLRLRYVDNQFNRIRISVRIRNSPSTNLGRTISAIRSAAEGAMNGSARVTVTGTLAVFDAQGSELVWAQTISLLIALSCITALMIVQFRSFLLGMLSLIPNMLPLAIIFGFMGWFGISLDSVTVFAATVSIGLSVDDTIHYLTQLRRQMSSGTDNVEACLTRAYRITAKALISTSAVLFFGFLALLTSPFDPVTSFGFLGASAIVAALLGDLIFMPAIILSFSSIKKLVQREMTG